jgi:hypothetical protein
LKATWELSQDAVVGDHLGQVYEKQHKTTAAIHMYQLAVAANPKFEEARTHLSHLHAAFSPLAGAELSTMRTIKLPRFATVTGSSEIFVLASEHKVEDVLFLSGSDKMKPKKTMFAPATFKSQFPTGSSAFVLRRGILSCFQITGCSLVLYNPDSVHSIN